MAVDRGYGSGKPLSAAQSAARRAAAGKAASRKKTIQKQAANKAVRLGVSRVGKTESAGFNIGGRKYLETGVSPAKLLSAANALRAVGQGLFPATRALASRTAAKQIGQSAAKNIAQSRYLASTASRELSPVAKMLPTMFKTEAKAAGGVARGGARSLYPQAEMAANEARLSKLQAALKKRRGVRP